MATVHVVVVAGPLHTSEKLQVKVGTNKLVL